MLKTSLEYDKGTIIIRGLSQIPFARMDYRLKVMRALALHYQNIINYLNNSQIEYVDNVKDLIPTPNLIIQEKNLNLRDYQRKAINNWIHGGKRGSIILPTGSGKTIIGAKIIETINSSAIIVVPTIDLMFQWIKLLSIYFKDSEIGALGGGEENIQGITVTTYDSAYLRASVIGNKFSLIIFDELHHLAAPGYRSIAEQFISPYRLGLTATFEREDNLHLLLPELVGGIVFRSNVKDLAKNNFLAKFQIERHYVTMLPEEILEYTKNYQMYTSILNRLGYNNLNNRIRLQKLIMMSGKNQYARDAILARNKFIDIAFNSKAKIIELRKILSENIRFKTIIFTQHNKLVYTISDTFLIPFITHKSSKSEREDVLNGFKTGKYKVLVTSKVLDEGVDVPDAELGIIVSGTGSKREFTQRLGRILRPKKNSQSRVRLIELISSGTTETVTSKRRQQALKKI